jgi:hypothetical protein
MFSRPKPMAHSLYPILWPDLEKAQFLAENNGVLAERVGFEPTVRSRAQRFSSSKAPVADCAAQ